jgi:hypothetical protein
LSYYLIKKACQKAFWDGERWQREVERAKAYRFDELPESLPIRNGADVFAGKTDLRYRLDGAIIANCWPTLMRAMPRGEFEYTRSARIHGD